MVFAPEDVRGDRDGTQGRAVGQGARPAEHGHGQRDVRRPAARLARLESALARCCACLFDNAYGIVMHVLLWISVIFTMVFCIIAEAIAIIVLAADRACALQETHGVTLILSSTYALILGMLNDPPINAGLPAIDITNTTDARIMEMCDVSPVLLEASGKIVGGGVMLLLASVVQRMKDVQPTPATHYRKARLKAGEIVYKAPFGSN